jgi:cytoskeletal protein RodZ
MIQDVGSRLKKIRLSKGLTLEEIQKKTRIHLNILTAIEGDGLTNLSPVYLKGFVKIYCQFLGVDPKECIPDLKDSPRTFSVHQDPPEEHKSKPVAEIKHSLGGRPAFKLPENSRKIIVTVLAVAVAALTFFNLGRFVSGCKRNAPAVPERKMKEPKSKVQAAVPSQPKEVSSGVRLTIIARENSMVTLKVDGKVLQQGLFAKGRSETWKAKDRMELSVTNAGGLELLVNSQRVYPLGKKNQKINNIVIDKQGMRIP